MRDLIMLKKPLTETDRRENRRHLAVGCYLDDIRCLRAGQATAEEVYEYRPEVEAAGATDLGSVEEYSNGAKNVFLRKNGQVIAFVRIR